MTEQTPQDPATGDNSTPTTPEQPAPQPPAPQYSAPQQYPAPQQPQQYPAPQQPQQYPAPQQPQQYPTPQQPGSGYYSYAEQPAPAAPGAPAVSAMPGAPVPPAQQPTNTLAILSLILAFIVAPAGIITGHIALGKIKRTGEPGRGIALAGTIVGYVFTGLAVIGTVIAIMFTVLLGGIAYTAAGSGIQQLEEYGEYGDFDSNDYGTDRSSGDLLDTPEKVLEAWQPCALALEIDTNDGDAFYDDIEWLAAQEALARLMDPSPEADAIREYVDYLVTNESFDYNLTAAYVDALAASSAKLCTQ